MPRTIAMKHRLLIAPVMVLFSGLLAACGSTSASKPSSTKKTSVVNISLSHQPAGIVDLSWNSSSKMVTAKVNMYGFTPKSSHAMHIHTSSCQSQGGVLVPFPDIKATSKGVIQTTVQGKSALPNGLHSGTYLNIHLGSSSQLNTKLGFTPVSCANIPSTSKSAIRLNMAAPPQSGLHPTGTAKVTYNLSSKTLTVVMNASGLPPGKHVAHLHKGTCRQQGGVMHDLRSLRANSSGDASSTSVIKGWNRPYSSSGWYINVHLGTSTIRASADRIVKSGKPTIYFDPLLCGNVPASVIK